MTIDPKTLGPYLISFANPKDDARFATRTRLATYNTIRDMMVSNTRVPMGVGYTPEIGWFVIELDTIGNPHMVWNERDSHAEAKNR